LPVNIHHGLLSIVVIIMIIAMLTTTTYVTISNMLADAYRYEKALEKANEKVRIAATYRYSDVVYGIRNVGLSEIVISEAGIIYSDGTKDIYVSNLNIKPGDIYTGRRSTSKTPITFYVITSRGNVFSAEVLDFTQTGAQDVSIRTLMPSVYSVDTSIKYGLPYVYRASVSTYGYVFAFLFVDDPYSDDNIYLKIGPINVADIYKYRNIPYYSGQIIQTTSRITVNMSLKFEISNDMSESSVPHYKLTVPINIQKIYSFTPGLSIYGCFGFIWRIMPNNMYSYTLVNPIQYSRYVSSDNYYIEERLETIIIPSALDIDSLVTSLAGVRGISYLSAPSGGQAYIVFAKCFKIEDRNLWTFKTTEPNPQTVVNGFTIYTNIVFPGRTYTSSNPIEVNEIRLRVVIDPQIYVLTALGNI